MSKRNEIIAILREWHWDGGTEPVADRILACLAEPSMAPAEEAAIRKFDAEYHTDWIDKMLVGSAPRDRRHLLAELDRLRGLMSEPSDAMVEAAKRAMATGDDFSIDAMARAALVAAGKEVVKP